MMIPEKFAIICFVGIATLFLIVFWDQSMWRVRMIMAKIASLFHQKDKNFLSMKEDLYFRTLARKFWHTWWAIKRADNPQAAHSIASLPSGGVDCISFEFLNTLNRMFLHDSSLVFTIFTYDPVGNTFAPSLAPGQYTRKQFVDMVNAALGWAKNTSNDWFRIEEEK